MAPLSDIPSVGAAPTPATAGSIGTSTDGSAALSAAVVPSPRADTVVRDSVASNMFRKQPSPPSDRYAVFGWMFDLFTVAVSLSDVVSDVVVAIQFYQGGQTVWFALVVTSLCLASVVYTVYFTEIVRRSAAWGSIVIGSTSVRNASSLVVYPVVLLCAQVMPVICWVVETRARRGGWLPPASSALGDAGLTESVVGREAVSDAKATALLMGRLQASLQHYLKAHGMFLIETVVEAIPQIVIQLLAVTFLGHATTAQVVSMSLSLLSVVSKAHVVAHSFDMGVFIFRMALPAFDLFSFFYLCATILEPGSSRDVQLPGTTLTVSYLTAAWLLMFVVSSVYFVASGAFWFILGSCTRAYRRRYHIVMILPRLILGGILLPFFLIAKELCKVSWLALELQMVQPRAIAGHALLFRFVLAAGSEEERERRFRHMLECFDGDEYRPMRLRRARLPALRESGEELVTAEMLAMPPAQFRSSRLTELRTPPRRLPLGLDDPYASLARCDASFPCFASGFFAVAICVNALSCVFNILYPFLNCAAVTPPQRQTTLQLMCLAPILVTLAVAVPLAPRAWRYRQFCLKVHSFGSMPPERAIRWLESYFHPPVELILADCIPESTLPLDVVASHLSAWLAPSDAGVASISPLECRRIREERATLTVSCAAYLSANQTAPDCLSSA